MFSNVAFSKVETVPELDMERYLGDWYEIAAIPQRFQKECVSNVLAEYKKGDDGIIEVLNSCEKEDGSRKVAEARARKEDPDEPSKLEVTFVNFLGWRFLFSGQYWVIDLNEDYTYAVVGDESTRYGWILSRTKTLSPELIERAKAVLTKNGYDTCKFLTTIQDGGFTEKKKLCEI